MHPAGPWRRRRNVQAIEPPITIKDWGTSERILLTHDLQIERVRGNAGCESSLHLHFHRHNLFFVLDGCLRIERLGYEPKNLFRGDSLLVPAGLIHRMGFIEDSIALEVYYTDGADVDPDDIKRVAKGRVA